MQIRSILLSNFRSFGPASTTIELGNLTCLIGVNASGKSAVLCALTKMFGAANSDRMLERTDFHIPSDENPDDIAEVKLLIEVRIEFPELESDDTEGPNAVPECFNQMIVEEEGVAPFCRIRLEARWVRSNTQDGEIEQTLSWITTGADEIKDEHRKLMRGSERSRIEVLYVPAARDPSRQLRSGAASMMTRVLSAVRWSDSVRATVADVSAKVTTEFDSEAAVARIHSAMRQNWTALHAGTNYQEPSFRPLARDLADLIRKIEVIFQPTPHGREDRVQQLSEGMQSLFYFSLVGMVFDLEEELLLLKGTANQQLGEDAVGFDLDRLNPPSLVFLAIEEPENHLAPHYLGRVMERFRRLSTATRGQVLLTSHSPSVMGRVAPEEVRYLRLQADTSESMVRPITLPDDQAEAGKYVREAVRAFPELYFSRLVVLGEGDSEEVVLPRLARACGTAIDSSFVSFVPLGGRHVNHMWRLLNDLEIPFLTLLDLDRERDGGGWGRIKYACQQLMEIGTDSKALLAINTGKGKTGYLSEKQLEEMHTWAVGDGKSLTSWTQVLEKHDVFFSAPLDLDFAMLCSFEGAYTALAVDLLGPDVPAPEDEGYEEDRSAVVRAVLNKKLEKSATYTAEQETLFFWYRYLFLNRSKPSTHLAAISSLTDAELKAGAPEVLKRLMLQMKKKL